MPQIYADECASVNDKIQHMNRERLLVWLLRLAGATEILAFIAVVMPRSWMEIANASVGLGEMPHGPLLMFMIRQASYTYGVHGLSLWLIASRR